MLPVSHLLAPVVLLQVYGLWTGRAVRPGRVLLVAFFGILPDLLNVHISLAERASLSHSVFFLLPFLAAALLLEGRWRSVARLGAVGVGVHLVLDLASNPYNVLYPFPVAVPDYPVLADCGMATFICWYAADVVFLLAFIGLTYRDTLKAVIRSTGP